jgi:hypothetical protein
MSPNHAGTLAIFPKIRLKTCVPTASPMPPTRALARLSARSPPHREPLGQRGRAGGHDRPRGFTRLGRRGDAVVVGHGRVGVGHARHPDAADLPAFDAEAGQEVVILGAVRTAAHGHRAGGDAAEVGEQVAGEVVFDGGFAVVQGAFEVGPLDEVIALAGGVGRELVRGGQRGAGLAGLEALGDLRGRGGAVVRR